MRLPAYSDDPNSAISFAFIHAEKLTLRMENGFGCSKYKPADYGRLEAIVDAKRQKSELIGQKVNSNCRYRSNAIIKSISVTFNMMIQKQMETNMQ